MSCAKLIQHYNRLNGNAISLPKLKEFHQLVQVELDADSHGPHVKELRGIQTRVTAAIKRLTAAGATGYERIEVTPIKIKEQKHRSPIAKRIMDKTPKAVKDKVKKYSHKKVVDYDTELLYGLETSNPDGTDPGLGFTQDGQKKIYEMVTNMILDTMKQDKLFWREPWGGGGKKSKKVKVNIMGPMPANFVTKAPYSGVNYWLLKYVAPGQGGYEVLNYLTINQVNQLGGKVKKGAKAWPVIYYSLMYRYNGKNITEDQYEALSDDERLKAQKIPFIQYYRVFNAHDVEGVPGIMEQVQARKTVLQYDVEPIKAAESIVNGMPKRPHIQQSKQRRAYYSPGGDFVHMPYIGVFDKEQEYYSTFFHELVHSTGHESRLDRVLSQEKKKYSFEELIAELGASYLCAESGILYFTLKNSAAYIKGWSKNLRDEMEADSKFFLKAAAKAQQAADFIADRKKEPKAVVPKASKSMRASKSPVARPERKERDKVAAMPSPMKQVAGVPNLSGVDYQYHEINLGPYKKDFHRMYSDTIVQLHGMPGHGKTVWLLKHAQYRAEQGENTLYVAREEFGRSVFDMKLKEHNIGHANLRFRKTLTPEDLAWAQVIFLDSVTALDLDHKAVEKLAADNPNKNWFLVLQSTKEGDFRGSQEWEHLVDIAGEISNRKLILRKNRLDPNNSVKAEKKRIDDAITEGKKKLELREAVKAQIAKPKPEIVNHKIISSPVTP